METSGFDNLVHLLNLSPYQASVLRRAGQRYDISRLEVRNGILFAPVRTRGAIDYCASVIFGRARDVIARDAIMRRNCRIKSDRVLR